jgi:hypothetical protein
MQASHNGDWGQLWQMAQRLGSQRQNPPASGPDDLFNKPSSQAGLIQSIYSARADGTSA